MAERPRLAVWKFSSCDGCQLQLLDCEDELLELAGRVEISYFLEASSAVRPGPYDLSLVEGSIASPADVGRIQRVRRVSHRLVTIGACATAGGIQALRNFGTLRDVAAAVYPRPELLSSLETSTPISAHVPVDLELHGCPVDRRQLLEVIAAHLHGRRPVVPAHSVCVECKARGTTCVLVARAALCLGPVTQAGCGAICPAYGRGCYACFGPAESADTRALGAAWRRLGAGAGDVTRALRGVNAWAPAFRDPPPQALPGDRRG
ncbi:MAG TPA: oxidoreductase, partial [Candidatus Eisenbacteria bacterium]|nr:oxidoreductase [Candidatus Eisenbacteria bacterium]